MAEGEEYVVAAMDAIMTLLDVEHALVHPEIEARIAQKNYRGAEGNINPHHITTALRTLRTQGRIRYTRAPTKGGETYDTVSRADTTGRETRIDTAAARKRLLLARYMGWATGTKRYPRGLIGPAGEQAVRLGLAASAAIQPAMAGFGEVTSLLGVPLIGTADSGGYIVPVIDGMPGMPVTTIVETKNTRSWVYPSSIELFQLLDKAARLQQARPDSAIAPVITCHLAHTTTFWMAKQLGFVAIDLGAQFIATSVDDDALLEVRNELAFSDLHKVNGPSLRVRDRFRDVIPGICHDVAAVWKKTALDPELSQLFTQLKAEKRNQYRRALMDQLRLRNRQLGNSGGW